MAELVHRRLERTLRQLEEMERIGLFNDNEIKSIVKKRTSFEYKLRQKKKDHYLKYIEYEINLLELISKRRERLLCEEKKAEIDNAIAKGINGLFKAAIKQFPEDEKLRLDQIQFAKKMESSRSEKNSPSLQLHAIKWYDSINALHTQLLQVHSKNPALWVMAAKWEMEESRLPENARKLLQRGVLMNPHSELLWREYFRMELMYIDLIRKRKAVLESRNMDDMDVDENDVILNGQVADVVYDKAVEVINDVEYALSFIQICLDFDFGSRHIDHILQDVEDRFPNKEETLDALAKQPLLNVQEEIKRGKELGIKKRIILDRINEEIHSKYEEAIKILPTEKMWSFYIEFILSLLNSAKESKKDSLQDTAISLMERAHSAKSLALSFYSEWAKFTVSRLLKFASGKKIFLRCCEQVDLLFDRGEEDEALNIALNTAKRWNTVDLWFKCLTYHIQCMQPQDVIYEHLMEAINCVNEKDSVILWKLGVDWLSICNPEKLIEFFEMGIKKPKEISVPLKEMYLEVTALKNGVPEARALYKKFKKMGSLSPHIVKKMIKIEKGQLNAPIENLRKYYEDGIKEYGSVNVDIWLDYMKLEVEHVGGEPTSNGHLIWRAKKVLEPDQLQEFQSRLCGSYHGHLDPEL